MKLQEIMEAADKKSLAVTDLVFNIDSLKREGFMLLPDLQYVAPKGTRMKEWKDDFRLPANLRLTSLEGCPEHITGNCEISSGVLLTSLKGCPNIVDRSFTLTSLGIKDLIGGPSSATHYTINGVFGDHSQLESLEGSPTNCTAFYLYSCGKLTSLAGITKKLRALSIQDCGKINNFKNLNKDIQSLETLSLTDIIIISNILSLILINNLNNIPIIFSRMSEHSDEAKNMKTAFNILRKYLGKSNQGVMDAQRELIDAGLQEFAKL